jgi:hypothetical protein
VTARPILFQADMVRALLDGRKTQTRRVLKRQPVHANRHYEHANRFEFWGGDYFDHGELHSAGYEVGDLLWVRETWAHVDDVPQPSCQHLLDKVLHRADPGVSPDDATRWRPSIHMPRWASRLTLKVTHVRVERLQAISEADALAEGVTEETATHVSAGGLTAPIDHASTHRGRFAHLWIRINAKRGFGWGANPWVVAITFTPHRCNVDKFASEVSA